MKCLAVCRPPARSTIAGMTHACVPNSTMRLRRSRSASRRRHRRRDRSPAAHARQPSRRHAERPHRRTPRASGDWRRFHRQTSPGTWRRSRRHRCLRDPRCCSHRRRPPARGATDHWGCWVLRLLSTSDRRSPLRRLCWNPRHRCRGRTTPRTGRPGLDGARVACPLFRAMRWGQPVTSPDGIWLRVSLVTSWTCWPGRRPWQPR